MTTILGAPTRWQALLREVQVRWLTWRTWCRYCRRAARLELPDGDTRYCSAYCQGADAEDQAIA